MVVSPLRAMLQARLELIWNSMSRGSGILAFLSGGVILTLGVACLGAPFFMMTVFGAQLGEDLPAVGSPAITWLGTLHALFVFGLGGLAGLRQHRGIDRELLRSLPLRPSQLLLAELPFGLLDTIPVLGLTFYCGLGLGLLRALPGTGVCVALLAVQGVLAVLLVQQLVGTLRRLFSRPRAVAIGLALAALPLLSFAAFSIERGLGSAYDKIITWLPTTISSHALRSWAQGDKGAATVFVLLSLLFTAALFALTTWLQLKEIQQDPPLRSARTGKDDLWTFDSPTAGVARLFVVQVFGARFGKILAVLPTFLAGMFVLVAGILQRSAAGRESSEPLSTMIEILDKLLSYPLFALVPPLVVIFSRELWMNQFAWDGGGLKSLFLAPLRSEEILRGKLLGLLCLQVPVAMIACLPLLVLRVPTFGEFMAGLAMAEFAAIAMGTLGHVLSARFPRPLSESGEGATSCPFSLQLLSTVAILVVGGTCLSLHAALAAMHSLGPLFGFVLLSLALAFAHWAATRRLSHTLDEHREELVETLA